jgi:hypothetical protein
MVCALLRNQRTFAAKVQTTVAQPLLDAVPQMEATR